ncbi:MAG: hypothetical protein C0498_10825 [Anaerolinea sp.]|nr:hypothetical protein [Anaerolinea sp.]
MHAGEQPRDPQARPRDRRTTLVAGALVWLLFIANLAYDVLRDGRVTGFSVVVLAALVIGTLYARYRGLMGRAPVRFVWFTYLLVALVLVALAINFVLSTVVT